MHYVISDAMNNRYVIYDNRRSKKDYISVTELQIIISFSEAYLNKRKM